MPFKQAITEKPRFMEPEKGIGAAGKGSIMHFVMQHLDLERLAAVSMEGCEASAFIAKNPENEISTLGLTAAGVKAADSAFAAEVGAQLSSMVEKEQLTVAEAETVNVKAICRFFRNTVGKRMLGNSCVRRETAFNIEIKLNEIYKKLPDDLYVNETMLLQGVIDCWFETWDGLVLLDYKTDYVPPGGSSQIKERYRIQLDYYTRALEQITGKRVVEKYLYLFYSNELLS